LQKFVDEKLRPGTLGLILKTSLLHQIARLAIPMAAAVLFAFPCGAFARSPWGKFEHKPPEWHRSPEGLRIAGNVLSWQSAHGSWPKNQDTTANVFEGDPKSLAGTFDNGATTGELRFLARAFQATEDLRYKEAVVKGLDAILAAQYPTGGWPQLFPPGKGYHRHITFNDHAMVRLMKLLRDVAASPEFEFLGEKRRAAAKDSFDRGVQCILDSQIVVEGRRTVWCAQHDEVDLSPRPGRSYELASLSGAESAGILLLLMDIEEPGPEVIAAIRAGVQWFETAKITGIRQVIVDGDKRIVNDPSASPMWARFYEIETNRPIFAGRDGIKKYDMSEIEAERRNRYAWYGPWGEDVLHAYVEWQRRVAALSVRSEE
jgi:PelA/Pel-15E family pectate lyase